MSESDWELIEDQPKKMSSQKSSDWEVAPESISKNNYPRQEKFGESLIKAIPRIGEDITRGGAEFLKNIPGYYKTAKTEIPAIPELIRSQPKHAAMQALAGTQEAINNLAQLPKGLANYLSQRLNLIPQSAANVVSKITPEDTTQAIQSLFGEPQYPGEKLIRGVGRNALNLAGTGKLSSVLNPLNLTAKNIAKDVIETGKSNQSKYTKMYNNLWKDSKKNDVHDMSFVSPDIDIDTLRKYSPKKSIVGVEEFLKNPNVETAHRAKSDLSRMQRKLEGSTTLNTAERKHYKAINDAVDDIQENMFKNKSGEVNKDLKNKYNIIQQGFANEVLPYRNKSIKKYQRNEINANELVNKLSQGEFAAKRGDYHKAIGLRNKLLPFLTGAAAVGGAGWLYNNTMGNEEEQ